MTNKLISNFAELRPFLFEKNCSFKLGQALNNETKDKSPLTSNFGNIDS